MSDGEDDGVFDMEYLDDGPAYCERCCNTGSLDCHCGGDLCVCERGGEYDCPACSA